MLYAGRSLSTQHTDSPVQSTERIWTKYTRMWLRCAYTQYRHMQERVFFSFAEYIVVSRSTYLRAVLFIILFVIFFFLLLLFRNSPLVVCARCCALQTCATMMISFSAFRMQTNNIDTICRSFAFAFRHANRRTNMDVALDNVECSCLCEACGSMTSCFVTHI